MNSSRNPQIRKNRADIDKSIADHLSRKWMTPLPVKTLRLYVLDTIFQLEKFE